MENTKIEWCDHTFNAWTGCTKISPGCDHCYAEGWAKRSGTVIWGAGEPRRRTTPANWRKPLQWQANAAAFLATHGRRQRVFCSSLADVFDNAADPGWRADLFRLIETTPDLDWLLLTKRIGNAANMMFLARGGRMPLLSNVWIGATIVNQEEADRDIPKLLAMPSRVRFLSIEPMLGPVDLTGHLWGKAAPCTDCPQDADCHCGYTTREQLEQMDGEPALHWVICGGESGPGARPMHPDWARNLRDQCLDAGVPFLFKQWGEHAPDGTGDRRVLIRADGSIRDTATPDGIGFHAPSGGAAFVYRIGKKTAGRVLDGMTHDGFPEAA